MENFTRVKKVTLSEQELKKNAITHAVFLQRPTCENGLLAKWNVWKAFSKGRDDNRPAWKQFSILNVRSGRS